MFSEEKIVELMISTIQNGHNKIMATIYSGDGFSEIKFYLNSSDSQWIREKVNNEIPKNIYKERSKQLLALNREKEVNSKNSPDYWNLCTIEVSRDGTHSIDFAYKPELDEENKKETIESIGQELYDKYKREDEERRQQARLQPEPEPEPETPSGAETFTVPELLGFIATELQADIPSSWKKLIVAAELFEEDGKQAVSMISQYVTDGDPQRFTPSNSIGPMNALIKLQRLMAKDGHTWRKARLTFESQGGVKVEPLE